jgi:Ca2+-binding RTX toxin-like protein
MVATLVLGLNWYGEATISGWMEDTFYSREGNNSFRTIGHATTGTITIDNINQTDDGRKLWHAGITLHGDNLRLTVSGQWTGTVNDISFDDAAFTGLRRTAFQLQGISLDAGALQTRFASIAGYSPGPQAALAQLFEALPTAILGTVDSDIVDYVNGGRGVTRINLGAGDDILGETGSVLAPMTADGGAGRDTIRLAAYLGVFTIDVAARTVAIDGATMLHFKNFERFTVDYTSTLFLGVDADDEIHCTNPFRGNDTLFGGLGNDTLAAGGSDDRVFGGKGNDTVLIGAGADRLYGGDGIDTAAFERIYSVGVVRIDLATGRAAFKTSTGWEVSRLFGFEHLTGSDFKDDIKGSTAANRLVGGYGNDTIWGQGGEDWIYGQSEDDVLIGSDGAQHLFGGSGKDTLIGDLGADMIFGGGGADRIDAQGIGDALTGGAGTDTFVFTRSDHATITDFNIVDDTLDLRQVSYFPNLTAVLSNARNVTDGIVIAYGGVAVHLDGLTRADLRIMDLDYRGDPL